MKIGLVRRGYSRTGGAEAYLRRFAETLLAIGHEVVLFTDRWPREEWPGSLIQVPSASPRSFADGLERMRSRDWCDFLFSLERIWTCDAYRAGDGVHAAWLEQRSKFEPPWKAWFRHFSGKHREILALEKRLFSPTGAKTVIANSRFIKRQIVRHFGYPESQIHVVYNGVPSFSVPDETREQTRRELGLKENDYAVLFAGTGWERKGLRFALAAMNAVRTPGARLLIAGRGSSSGLPKSDRAKFLGPVKDMPRLLAAADAFILPTLYDPFSNACLEALGAGLPVITSAFNGFAEIIKPGEQGEVVAQPSDIAGLAAAIDRWGDAQRRQTMRSPLQALAARYNMAANVERTLSVMGWGAGN